jgi:hypothetical protein
MESVSRRRIKLVFVPSVEDWDYCTDGEDIIQSMASGAAKAMPSACFADEPVPYKPPKPTKRQIAAAARAAAAAEARAVEAQKEEDLCAFVSSLRPRSLCSPGMVVETEFIRSVGKLLKFHAVFLQYSACREYVRRTDVKFEAPIGDYEALAKEKESVRLALLGLPPVDTPTHTTEDK